MAVQKFTGSTAAQLAASLESSILSGRSVPGALLPTVRALAEQAGVSPATAAAAYRIVRDRGLIVADGRRGTTVRNAAPVSARIRRAIPANVRDLSEGNPDPRMLPDIGAVLREVKTGPRLYGESLNDARLLRLASTQFESDGVSPEWISVTGGALDGIERVLRENLRAGDRVLVEDPCFIGILDLLAALAIVPVPVAIDDEGMIAAELRRALNPSIAALIITPRAQNPTGAALSARRSRQLRAALHARPDLLIVEDDHAGPVAGAPYVTLVAADRQAWAVVRSVSKSLGPDLRVAVMASDRRTHERVEARQTVGIRWVSHVLQEIVAGLWSDRKTQRLLATAAESYRERRAALITALAAHGLESHGVSGLNVWIHVPEEAAIVQALFQAGWAVNAGEPYRLRSRPAIRVSIAELEPEGARTLAAEIAAILNLRAGHGRV